MKQNDTFITPSNNVPFQERNYNTNINGFNIDVYCKKSIEKSRYYNKDVAESCYQNYINDNSSYLHFTDHKVEFLEKDLNKLDNISKLHYAHMLQKKDKMEVYNKIEKSILQSPFITSTTGIMNSIINNKSEKDKTVKVDLNDVKSPRSYLMNNK